MAVATLGMYDPPWLQARTDAFWAGLEFAAGVTLDRARPIEAVLTDPALLLGQTCGVPLVTTLAGRVRLVATPRYDLPGCDGPSYCSFLVVRTDEPAASLAGLRGRRAAINGRDSNSGHNVFRAAVARLAGGRAFFAHVVETGAHLASLAAVAAGEADVAAIDCVTHGLAARYRPELLAGTRVLARSVGTPGLPLVTALDTSEATIARMREELAAARDPALGWVGAEVLDPSAYDAILALEREAMAQGYSLLC